MVVTITYIDHSPIFPYSLIIDFDIFNRIDELDITRIINERYWSDFKEEKQAEFLAFESVQWKAIQQIGVKTQAIADEVTALLLMAQHKPDVIVKPEWYY
jgi:hypothetical protein